MKLVYENFETINVDVVDQENIIHPALLTIVRKLTKNQKELQLIGETRIDRLQIDGKKALRINHDDFEMDSSIYRIVIN